MGRKKVVALFFIFIFTFILAACSGQEYKGDAEVITIKPQALHVYQDGSYLAAEGGLVELEAVRVKMSVWEDPYYLSEWKKFQYNKNGVDQSNRDLLHHLSAFMQTEEEIKCEEYSNGLLCSEVLLNEGFECSFGRCYYNGKVLSEEHNLEGVENLRLVFFPRPQGEVVIHK